MTPSLREALSAIRDNYDSLNWWRNRVFLPYVLGTATRLHPGYPGYDEAVHVMEEDWDTLVVLDACRADVFEDVVDLDQFDEYEWVASLGSHSSEWTRRNFRGRTFGDTVYVSANPHTALEAGDAFHRVVELWETATDDAEGVVLPEDVRDAAVAAHGEYPDKRLVVHFMQPHAPLIGSDDRPADGEYDSAERYWKAYADTLEYVLPYARDVADSIPGRTVFTADHGELFNGGNRRRLGFPPHPPGLRLPALVYVPWAVLDGERRRIRAGSVTEAAGESVEERLEQLGYR
jgi:hypothetical protein